MPSISSLKRWARKTAPNLYRRYVEHHRAKLPVKVRQLLLEPAPPVTLGETQFDEMQNRYQQWWPQYDFDVLSTGKRAYDRARLFLELTPLAEPGKKVLEMACGDGMTGTALSVYGHRVTLLDYQDWRDDRARGLSFIQADLGGPLALPDSNYDFIFSFNAFEHIQNPSIMLNEAVRILRPGGLILIDFNPLYCSPLGLHAFSFKMPYPQFLFTDELIQKKLGQLGLNDLGRDMTELQPLNRWRPAQFRALWERKDCKVLEYKENMDFIHLDLVAQHPQAFQGRGLCLDDLTVAGMRVLLQKL